MFGNTDHLRQHRPEQQKRQYRADEDTRKRPARSGGLAHSAIKRPRGAVDRQRQAINDGAPPGGAMGARAAVAVPSNAE